MARLENIDLNLLLSLHWLLKERSVSAAAVQMSVTQPAMSRSLARLRDIFHDPVLVKAGRTMEATPLAESLQPQINEAIERLRLIVRQDRSFDPETQAGSVTIASVDYLTILVIEAWTKAIAPLAPKMDLHLVNLTLDSAQDLIIGKTDFTIFPDIILPKLPASIDTQQFVRRDLFTQQFFSAVRRNHPLAERKIDVDSFLDYPHILINPEGGSAGILDEELNKIGKARNISYYTHSFLSAVSIVRKSDAILTAASGIFENECCGLTFFQPPVTMPPLNFMASWHPNWTGDPRHKWVRDRLLPELTRLNKRQSSLKVG